MNFDFFGLRNLFLVPIALVIGLDLIVLLRANAALALNFGLERLALILFAMSIGFIQVAGSDTTLPLRGPDVHLNFFLMLLPPLPLPNICSPPVASVIGCASNSS